MSNNKRSGGFFAGKGYYIALILCTVVIGITGYMYYRSAARTEPVSREETGTAELPALTEAVSDIPVIATEPEQTSPQTQPAQPVPAEPKKALKTMAPLAGEEIVGYSVEALSYNQTTRDWRIHNGVDIAAEEGKPVFAAADGVVEAAYEDDFMGYTVVIRHDGGYTTQYSSLAPELSVQAGEAVHMGQVIGCTGSTALVETTLGSHVHFSVTCQGQPMDPAEFLRLGQ